MDDVGPAIDSLHQAEQRLQDPAGIAGTLRLSMPPHFEPMWPLLSEFSQRYPAVRFDVMVADRRVDLVAEGIDVAIRIGEGGSGSYIGRTLARYRHIVLASPEFLERHPLHVPEDLTAMPCVCWRSNGPTIWRLGDEALRMEPVLTTNDYQHLTRVALAGEAVTELPPFLAQPPVQEGLLVPVLPDFPMPEQLVRAVIAERRLVSPLVDRFLDDAGSRLREILLPA
jgi:DNA-binding transcriptional LysR family regulator